ncbi:MAG: site-2 protease family protein [Leptospirales bacterium]|nr:site-2 protease family protein [Leptospirales bacterium]
MKFVSLIKNYISGLNNGITPRDIFAEDTSKERPAINILLFIITVASCAYMGANFFYTDAESAWTSGGFPYAAGIAAILLCHEFGHYFAARAFGVNTTYPYFIPFPSMIGTMGAVIKIKSTIPDRRALLYIGAMGPICGFIVTLILLAAGVYFSGVKKLPPGNALILGDPLLIKIMVRIFHGYIPYGHDLVLSPLAAAGWVGCLLTGLNLIPVSQLDGGHVFYAIAGAKQRAAGWLTLAIAGALSWFYFSGWIVWVILMLTVLKIGHPYTAPSENISLREKTIAALCALIFALTFIPAPLTIR